MTCLGSQSIERFCQNLQVQDTIDLVGSGVPVSGAPSAIYRYQGCFLPCTHVLGAPASIALHNRGGALSVYSLITALVVHQVFTKTLASVFAVLRSRVMLYVVYLDDLFGAESYLKLESNLSITIQTLEDLRWILILEKSLLLLSPDPGYQPGKGVTSVE